MSHQGLRINNSACCDLVWLLSCWLLHKMQLNITALLQPWGVASISSIAVQVTFCQSCAGMPTVMPLTCHGLCMHGTLRCSAKHNALSRHMQCNIVLLKEQRFEQLLNLLFHCCICNSPAVVKSSLDNCDRLPCCADTVRVLNGMC